MSVDPYLRGFDDPAALLDLVEGGARELNRRGVPVYVLQGEAAKLAISQSTEAAEREAAEASAADPHHEAQIIHDEAGFQDSRQ